MAFFDVFKKKKVEKPVVSRQKKKLVEKPKEVKKPAVPIQPAASKQEKTILPKEARKIVVGESYRILKAPHITEKATALVESNQYVFKVYPRANKIEVKKAVSHLYGVDVISVRIINVLAKKRRLGKILGEKKGFKKAIVTIKKGQKIELLPR